jgi:hypothetical protein
MRLWIVCITIAVIAISPVPAVSDDLDWDRIKIQGGCEAVVEMIKVRGLARIAKVLLWLRGILRTFLQIE